MIQNLNRAKEKRFGFFSIIAILGFLTIPFSGALAGGLVTTDYFLNHQSIEPVYKAKKLDPTVLIHVREVVLQGRERTAPAEGKVLLLAHGAATAGYIGFDGGCENCSMMRYFAQAGWDVFSVDYENYGLSTFSPVMDNPSWYPDETPTTTDVAGSDIARVIDFICNLRGVGKVSLFGWSFGAIRATPIYTIQNPGKVGKLVLFGGIYGGSDEKTRQQGEMLKKMKVYYSMPSPEAWIGYGTKVENLRPGAFEWFRDAVLASDPKSGELGGKYRFPTGPISDIYLAQVQFDASKITIPTLVIRAGNDAAGSTEDNKKLVERLSSKIKKYVEIPVGGHYIFFEKSNAEFYKAIKDFLEEKGN
jgi:pimeloyl-ACP methyl ester carboxylesterase